MQIEGQAITLDDIDETALERLIDERSDAQGAHRGASDRRGQLLGQRRALQRSIHEARHDRHSGHPIEPRDLEQVDELEAELAEIDRQLERASGSLNLAAATLGALTEALARLKRQLRGIGYSSPLVRALPNVIASGELDPVVAGEEAAPAAPSAAAAPVTAQGQPAAIRSSGPAAPAQHHGQSGPGGSPLEYVA